MAAGIRKESGPIINGCSVVSFSRMSSRCGKCDYRDYCESKRRERDDIATVTMSMGGTYTVKPGDSLWKISKQFYGTGAKHSLIYNANADVIEAAAKAHGKESSNNGHWILVGTVLTIPGFT